MVNRERCNKSAQLVGYGRAGAGGGGREAGQGEACRGLARALTSSASSGSSRLNTSARPCFLRCGRLQAAERRPGRTGQARAGHGCKPDFRPRKATLSAVRAQCLARMIPQRGLGGGAEESMHRKRARGYSRVDPVGCLRHLAAGLRLKVLRSLQLPSLVVGAAQRRGAGSAGPGSATRTR